MSQVLESPLEAGRDAVRRRDWDAAYPLLQEADTSSELAPEDLELLAESALWGGLFTEYMDATERSYKGYVEAGNLARAAYIATILAHDYGAPREGRGRRGQDAARRGERGGPRW